MHPSQTRETTFNKDEEKHGQREILERCNIRQVPNKRRVEVQSQNRDLLIRGRVHMSCMPQNVSYIFDHSEETRQYHSYFIRMISRTSSESDSSYNRVSNATKSVDGLITSKSRLEGRIKSASLTFLDQERLHYGTSRISSFSQTVCQHR